MTLQERLFELEERLIAGTFDDPEPWTRSVWPDPASEVHGMRVERATRKVDQDLLMVHRFETTPGPAALHVHPYAMAAHILGPGTYELGLGGAGKCHARVLCEADQGFYYEMLSPELQHYVLPKDDIPILTVAMWTPFRPLEVAPKPLQWWDPNWLTRAQEKVEEILDETS